MATVPDVARRNDYVGNSVTTVFAYTFMINDKSEIYALVDGVLRTVDIDYSVQGVGVDAGGTVTFFAVPGVVNVSLMDQTAFNQLSIYNANEDFPSQRVADDLNKHTRLLQQIREVLSRSLKFAKKSLNKNIDVDDPTDGKFAYYDLASNLIKWATLASGGTLPDPVTIARGGTGAVTATAARAALKVASSGTITAAATLPVTEDSFQIVSGNTGITALATLQIGTIVGLRFTGTPIITHSATLILLGAVNYQVAAGDMMMFVSEGGGSWREFWRRPVTNAIASKVFVGTGIWSDVIAIKESGGQILALGAIADGQNLQRSGTNVIGATPPALSPFTTEFISADQTVTAATLLNVVHGLGSKPKLIQVTLKNITADLAYSVGDEIIVSNDATSGGTVVLYDATNVTIISVAAINIPRKDTRVNTVITYANWKWVVRAWK